jgi:hypothetical protein
VLGLVHGDEAGVATAPLAHDLFLLLHGFEVGQANPLG